MGIFFSFAIQTIFGQTSYSAKIIFFGQMSFKALITVHGKSKGRYILQSICKSSTFVKPEGEKKETMDADEGSTSFNPSKIGFN